MLRLTKVAVTGGLSSGKSTVCSMFEELGAYVVSADEIVHQLLSPDSAIGQKIIQQLGSSIVSDRQFNRKKIADIVFTEPQKLKELEAILHPAVFAEVEKRYQEIKLKNKYALFVAEIPLLYESHTQDDYDVVITVSSSSELCKERFLAKGQRSSDEFNLRVSQQLDPNEKANKSDYVIINNSTLSELKKQVINIYSLLTQT